MQSSSIANKSLAQPGLLPWQKLFLFFLLGLLALAQPWAAVLSAILLFIFQISLLKGPGPGILQAAVFFGLGWAVQSLLYPSPQIPVPDWMQNREKVNIQAKILKVETKQHNRLQIILGKVDYKLDNGQQGRLPSRLLWNWYDPPQTWPAPGQQVLGSFRIRPIKGFANPGHKDSRFYWRGKGIKYRTYTSAEKTRLDFKGNPGFFWRLRLDLRQQILERTDPGSAQGLLLALLMGDRMLLDQETMEMVRRSSLAHSLALSGLHLGFLAAMGWGLAWLLGLIWPKIYLHLPRPKLAVYTAAPLILTYLWLGQAKPSLLRAALMFFFWGLLLLMGRNKKLLDGLFFAVLLIIFFDPAAVYDLGLQLSVVAVSGIVLAWPVFCSYFEHWKDQGLGSKILFFLLSILLVTLVANAALLPLISSYFGEISPHLYLNLFWLPLLGWLVLPLGLLALTCSQIPGLDFLSQSLFSASAWTINFMLTVLQSMQAKNLLQPLVMLRPLWPAMLGYWILFLLFVYCWPLKKRPPLKTASIAILLLLLPSGLHEWQTGKSRLELSLLDVGQGQAIYLQAPRGKRLLVDGGGSWNPDFDLGRYALAPVLTRNQEPRLHKVLLSHAHYDHYRGLYYPLNYFQIQQFLHNGYWPQGRDKKILDRILQEKEIQVIQLNQGDRIDLGPELYLEILHPPQGWDPQKVNDRSLVLRLVHQKRGIALLPGDIEQAALQKLLQNKDLDLQAQVLILPHHGSRSSLSQKFLQRVAPDMALASCGYLHHFNLPHTEVEQALHDLGIPMYSTAQNGALRISWNLRQNTLQLHKMLP